MVNLELFSCAGGMAEGFRRAGIRFDLAVDFEPDHCDSYERNIGHRPLCMDARDLLRLVRAGHIRLEVDLLVADPPCTPWSRAGKRLGTSDERDMLAVTCDLIAALRPWVTCREALAHLEGDELGRPVKMRKRTDHGKQKGSVADRPARTVGTSNLSDGNNLAIPRSRHDEPVHTSELDAPARAITTQCRAPGHATTVLFNSKHAPSAPSAPSRTIGAKSRGNGACAVSLAEPTSKHPAATPDEPSPTIRAGGGGHTGPHVMLANESGCKRKRPPSTQGPQSTRVMSPDSPATTIQAREDRIGSGSPVLDWPWDTSDDSDAVILSERAAAILQGFPDDGSWTFCGETKKARWSQLGQAMPPALAYAVATSVRAQDMQSDLASIHERERLRMLALESA